MARFRIKTLAKLTLSAALFDCAVVVVDLTSGSGASSMRIALLLFLYNLIAVNVFAYAYCHGQQPSGKGLFHEIVQLRDALSLRRMTHLFLLALVIGPPVVLLGVLFVYVLTSAQEVFLEAFPPLFTLSPGTEVLCAVALCGAAVAIVGGYPRVMIAGFLWMFFAFVATGTSSSPLYFESDAMVLQGVRWSLLLSGENLIYVISGKALRGHS